ncbi:MAG: dolichol kinase [Halobacteriales archaeon]
MAHELARRFVHAAGTLVPLPYLLGWVPWRWVAWFVLGGAGVAGVLELLRLAGRLDWRLFDLLTREYEQDNPAGYALYAAGMAAVVVLFRPVVAVPAMLMLTLGDPISGLLGSGSADGVKPLRVLAVMFGVCLLLALPHLRPAAAVAGALVATAADGVKPVVAGYVLDDNVTIPVGAGVAMWATDAALAAL